MSSSASPPIAASAPAPVTRHTSADIPAGNGLILRWMVLSAICVVLTLVIGGITRLTESGLSITEWKPIAGTLPPLSASAWAELFERYLRIPEAQTVHQGITLQEFRTLYWWEWIHRNFARLVGLVLAVPYLLLVVRRRVPRGLHGRLVALPLLVAAQGTVGWFMVRSGLSDRTDVSQYGLVAHLALALVIYVIAIDTALRLRSSPRRTHAAHPFAPVLLIALTFTTILSGGFVAGLDGGHVYNTFPWMGSGLVPVEMRQLQPAWRNLFENPAAAQFTHRCLASFTTAVALLGVVLARRRDGDVRRVWNAIGAIALLQFALGVATLLFGVPIVLASLHQLGAVALLTAGLWARQLTAG